MVVPHPHQCVVDKEPAHFVAVGVVHIHRFSPGRRVFFGEIRAELAEVIARRTEVVVHHVQQHGETPPVTGVHQRLQAIGTAIGLMRRIQIDTVIAPAVFTGKGTNRHDLHMGHAQLNQMVQSFDGALEGPRSGKCPHVHFINNGLRPVRRLPALIRPGKAAVIHPPGRPVNPLRLPGRARIGQRVAAVDDKLVIRPVLDVCRLTGPTAAGGRVHGETLTTRLKQNFPGQWCPDFDRRHLMCPPG